MLEYHSNARAQLGQVRPARADGDTVDDDLAAIERLEPIDAFDQRALSGPGRTAHDDDLALAHFHRAAREHFELAIRLVEVADGDHAATLRRRTRTNAEATEQRTK